MSAFCDLSFDGLGTACGRCGSWQRGKQPPLCPPYVTRCEPDGARLPSIKTAADNDKAFKAFVALDPAWGDA